MPTIIVIENNGQRFFLRGTAWAFSEDRADKFANQDEAKAALERAKKFIKPSQAKKAKFVEVAA
jgi:hypothetical protein